MQAVDADTLYTADPASSPEEDASSPPGPPPDPSSGTSPAPSAPEARPSEASPEHSPGTPSLSKKLRLALNQESLPELNPSLQPVSVGTVRADLKRQLDQAVAVLDTRYAHPVSKSLLLEFALRRTLLNLQERDTDSALVQWLDSELPRQ